TVYTGEYSGAVKVDVDYKDVGITLNIKPRISSDGRHVSMQIQTEVSEVMDYITANNVEVAPIVNTRKAQTSAQVENNTAFIIGGLIRNEKDHTIDRIPFISRIPLIGKLFQVSSITNQKREDIIVLTPRVLEPKGPKRAVLPKGSDQFNFTDCRLFRESYRLKTDDVFDLEFIKDNETLKHVFRRSDNFLRHYPSYRNKPPFDVVGGDRMPGEEAVVVRMLYEIAKNLNIHERVKLHNLIYFEKDPGKPAGYDVVFLGHKLNEIRGNKFQKKMEYPRKVLVLRYDLEPGAVLRQITHTPAAEVEVREVQSRDEMENLWYELNRLQPPSAENKDGVVCHRGQTGIVLDSMEDVERLRAAIVVREMISVNKMQSLLSVNNFKVGRKIQLPQINPDGDRIFLVDHNVSRYHYYTDFYYAAFQNKLRNYYERMREIFKEKDF
ncbi:MAG: type II and III secretion system protein, partial [Planctomycetes bacterium]|nr:type II and III secretion system protein [Planctomycetota bacterium]